MEARALRNVLPFVKEYAAGRGIHEDQIFPDGDHGHAVSALVGGAKKPSLIRTGISNTYCFSSLKSSSIANPSAILVQIQPCYDDLDKDAYHHYIEWVLNFSPWRHAFVSKSIRRAMRDGVVVLDPMTQGNTLLGALQAVRDAWENHCCNGRYRNVNLWWDIVSKGGDPSYAYAITAAMVKLNNGKTVSPGAENVNHSPIQPSNDNTENFVLGRMNDRSKPWVDERYGNSEACWDMPSSGKFEPMVWATLNNIGKDKAKVNPFAAKNNYGVYERQSFVDCIVESIPHMKEKLNVQA